MNTRWQIVCARCGPAALFVFFVGFATAGFFPPMRPDLDVGEVVRTYSEHTTAIRLGTFVMVFSSGLVTPFVAALSLHLRRMEDQRFPVLSLTQFAAGTTGIMMFLTQAMFWSIAAYRPERSPEITQTLNDIAWFFTVMPFCLIFIQALAVAGVVFSDKSERPVFPRWVGYLNLWCAVLYVPGGTCTFFKIGPLAWNGLFAFWVPACVYLTWFTVMAAQVSKAVRRYREEQLMSASKAVACRDDRHLDPAGVPRSRLIADPLHGLGGRTFPAPAALRPAEAAPPQGLDAAACCARRADLFAR